MKKTAIYIGLAVIALIAGYFAFRSFKNSEQTFSVETAKVERGSMSNTITATGTIEAINTVEVGTQVSGVIEKIYADYNTVVKKGQLLAQLDETPLLAQLDQSKANVDQAEAQVKYQKANYDRYKALVEKKLIAQADFDQVEYNYHNAIATLKNAQSVYDKNKINLSYARIYSPIDGIILDRAVDEGQTVAASFNTPTLFTIANDLTQMRVEAKVDEADIGQVKNGQRVEFTVDAFPDRKFSGEVTEIRLQPVVSSNVVTYTVAVNAPNPEKILMPGMTANAVFYVTEKKDILLVPAKAVRFTPDQSTLQAYMEKYSGGSPAVSGSAEEKPLMGDMTEGGPSDNNPQKKVWVKQGNQIFPQRVTVGATDEIHYEVISGLKEGDEVVESLALENGSNAKTANKAVRSPFMPQRPGANRQNGGGQRPAR